MLTTRLFWVLLIASLASTSASDETTGPIYKLTGENLTLTCKTSGRHVLKWFKDGQELDTTGSNRTKDRLSSDSASTSSSLTINPLETGDSGSYNCTREPGRETVAQYDVTIISIESDSKVLNDASKSVELQCKVKNGLSYSPITWKRNGKELANTTDDASPAYTLFGDANDTILNISNTDKNTAGLYTCVVEFIGIDQVFERDVGVHMAPSVSIAKEPKGKVEDETAVIECKVYGFPVPNVTWWKKSENGEENLIEYDTRIKALPNSDNVTGAKLEIKLLKIKTDRGSYRCLAKNYLNASDATVFLKVKDKLAAVWPFLGICAEVIILCAVIFIFEKRRNKKMEEDTEIDAVKQELMNHPNGTADDKEVELRQRPNSSPKS